MLSEFFHLSHFPFADGVDLNGLFQSPSFEQTYEELLMGVLDGRQVQLLVGPGGIGRTTLLGRLRAGLQPTDLCVVKLAYSHFDLEEFLTLLNAELAELPGADAYLPSQPEASPRAELTARLEGFREAGSPVVILIDDAENLGSAILNQLPEMLASNGPGEDDDDGGPLAQVVLAVQPEFAQRLTGIELDTLNASIDAIQHLEPWDRTTVTDYVCAAIESASGLPGEIFTEHALETIYRLSEGIPARVNRLCDHAMREAASQAKQRIGPEHVEAGAAAALDSTGTEAEEMNLNADRDAEPLSGSQSARGPRPDEEGWMPGVRRALGGFSVSVRERVDSLSASWEGATRRPRAALITGAVVVLLAAVTAGAFLLRPAAQAPEPSADSARFAAPRSSSLPSVASGTTPDFDARQERQLAQLTDAVSSLSRTLVSVEARMRSFDADISGLKQAMGELQQGPRTVLAKAEAPAPVAAARPSWPKPLADGATVPLSTTRTTPATPGQVTLGTSRPGGARAAIESMASNATGMYKVEKGDTLWHIARRQGTTVSALASLNGLSKDATLRTGQSLRVGTAPGREAWYTVRKGDSLYSIGKRFAIAPKHLAAWNCLGNAGRIFPGQRISVSEGSSDSCATKRG